MTNENNTWSDLLQCNWSHWVAVNEKTLHLYLPSYNVTDMTGCIKTASTLMPSVECVMVWSGGKQDTCYKKIDGKWRAILPLNAPRGVSGFRGKTSKNRPAPPLHPKGRGR